MPPDQPPEPRFCPECGRPISVRAHRCVRCAARHRAAAQRRYPTAPLPPVPPRPILWPALTDRHLRMIRRAPPETDWGALAQHLKLSRPMLVAIRAELLRARPPRHDPTPIDDASTGQAAD